MTHSRSTFRPRFRLLTALVLACLIAFGFAKEPKEGGTLRIGTPADAASLDPYVNTAANSSWVYNNVYETLVELTKDLTIEPNLAERWEQVDDTRWRFYLRDDVTFHDGTPFNAEAVKFNIERTINPDAPGRGASWIGPISGAEVVDEHTVDIVTTTPHPALLNALTMKFVLGMVSPSAVEKWGGDYGQHPVGTGPMKLEEWVNNDHVTLVKHEGYWGEAPLIDEILFRVIPDDGNRMLAFQNGEIDVLLNPTPIQLRIAQAVPGAEIHSAPGLRLNYLGMNATQPPFDDPRVRKAVAYAIDTKVMSERLLNGVADQAQSFVVTSAFGFKDVNLEERYAFDPQRARDLLAEAGWEDSDGDGVLDKDGQPLSATFVTTIGRDPGDKQVAEVIQQQLREAGIDVQLRFMEWAPLLTTLKEQSESYELYMMGWTTITLDSDFGLNSMFNAANVPPTGVNRMRYVSDEVTRLLNQAQSNLDTASREAQYQQVQEILAEDMPMVPLFHLRQVVVTQPWVKGYTMHPAEYYITDVDGVWLDR